MIRNKGVGLILKEIAWIMLYLPDNLEFLDQIWTCSGGRKFEYITTRACVCL